MEIKIPERIPGYYLNLVKQVIQMYAPDGGVIHLNRVEKTINGRMKSEDIEEAVNFLIKSDPLLKEKNYSVNYF